MKPKSNTRGGASRGALCLALTLAAACLLWGTPTAAQTPAGGSTVRGRVDRQGKTGPYPANYVKVTLIRESELKTGMRVQSFTGRDGSYSFYKVPPGAYILEIWNSDGARAGAYRIQVLNKPYTDIRPFVIP